MFPQGALSLRRRAQWLSWLEALYPQIEKQNEFRTSAIQYNGRTFFYTVATVVKWIQHEPHKETWYFYCFCFFFAQKNSPDKTEVLAPQTASGHINDCRGRKIIHHGWTQGDYGDEVHRFLVRAVRLLVKVKAGFYVFQSFVGVKLARRGHSDVEGLFPTCGGTPSTLHSSTSQERARL